MGWLVIGFILLVASFFLGSLAKFTTDEAKNNISRVIRIIAIVIMVAGLASATIITVPAGSNAVLMEFGAVKGSLNPGIHVITPYVNHTELMETRTQKEVAKGTASSKDLQSVSAEVAINYHVNGSQVADLYKNVGIDYKNRIIDPAVQESLKQVTARYTAEELIKKRGMVKTEVENEITSRLKSYGVIVESQGVSITNFDFSPEFNAAIEQKQVAQQSAEKQKYVLQQAVLEKETAITKAQGEAEASRIRALALKTSGGSRVIAEKWIDKWDGKLPVMQTGNNTMVNISDLMKNEVQ